MLRSLVRSSAFIRLFPRGSDTAFDNGGTDSDCLGTFVDTFMSGGNGPPTDISTITSINTGQERTMVIISSTEGLNGVSINTPQDRSVKQWNGTEWIPYSNLIRGQCPI